MHRPINNKTLQALEKIIAQNQVHEQLFKLGLDPEHLAIHQLHNVQPLIDLSYVIRIQDGKTIKAFVQLQHIIRAGLSKEQYYTAANEFHITLYTHVYADKNFQNCEITTQNFELTYKQYCQWAKAQADQVLAAQHSWGIMYTNILITPDSVIAVAEDTGIMQELRKKLVQYGNSKHFYDERDEKTIYPNIIHTTLVRFLAPVSLSERLEIYARLKNYLPLLLPVQISAIEFRQFERYGVFPQDSPLFTTYLPQE